ncbi:S-type pyocin domain-containing protein [Pseudomonas sp. SG20052]|uniref:S-type pyocin domain-containing protein n=1 Tax=Pseudomonas sp. SG20052 TaxID=3074147 RepID=UPI00287F9B99|nr:S-type pyocin domain-containing protein [Pseudomonas sp. SG20052]WNF56069.1 S-type pyocin domain-containing protein [Pseudomonas sp. SG20052]
MSGYVPNPPKGYRNTGVEPVDIGAQRWAEYKDLPQKRDAKPDSMGCVFAKNCNLPDGVIDYRNPAGFVPVDKLADYGLWAVLGTAAATTAQGTPLQLVGGSATSSAIAKRLGGSLALTLLEGSATVAAGAAMGTVALLIPNTNISPDSAFYKNEQYASLDTGRTRVRINVKTLPDGSVNAYGFYTGGKKEWENVRVIEAAKDGEKFVADIGNGIGLTWTPAANPDDVLGIPALEGAPQRPSVWVYPPTEQSNKALVNPEHPPEYQDAIIWFPSTDIQPIYIMLSARLSSGTVTGVGEDVAGIWLAGANTGLGAPIPTRIADVLRGREFSSFNTFRTAFWTAVKNDPELFSQFNEDAQDRLMSGNAPAVREREAVGTRGVFEIHHVEQIADGGAVYDVDNLRVNTPKNHINQHRKK